MAKKTKEERQAIRAQAEADKGAEKTNKKLAKAAPVEKQESSGKSDKFKQKLGKAVDKSKETRDKIHAAQDAGEITGAEAREKAGEAIDKFKKKGQKLDNRLNKTGEERRAQKKLDRGTEQTNKKLDKFADSEVKEAKQAEKEFGKPNILEAALSEPTSELTAQQIAEKAATEQQNARMFEETRGGISATEGNQIQKAIAAGGDRINALNAAVQQKSSGNGFAGTTDDIARSRNSSLDNSFAAETPEARGIVGLMNRYSDAPAAAEKITNQDLFADLGAPLQRGTYSGRTTGSVPIFVGGGGYVPLGIIDSRKRALTQAATNKAKQGEKLAELVYAQGAVEYQDQINDMSNELLEEYGAMVGYDWSKLNDGSPASLAFWKDVKDNQAFAKETIQHHTNASTMIDRAQKNEQYVPQEYLNQGMAYLEGSMDMSQWKKDPKKWKEQNRWMESWQNLKDVYNKQVPNIQEDYVNIIASQLDNPEIADTIKEAYVAALEVGEYTQIASATAKLVPDDRLHEITDLIHENSHLYGSKDATYDYFNANMGKEILTKSQMIKKWGSNHAGGNKKVKDQVFTNQYKIMKNPSTTQNVVDIANNNEHSIDEKVSEIQSSLEDATGLKMTTDNKGNVVDGKIQFDIELPTPEKRKSTEVSRNVSFWNDREESYQDFETYHRYLEIQEENLTPPLTDNEKLILDNLTSESNLSSVLTNITTQYQNRNGQGRRHTLTLDEVATNPKLAVDWSPSTTKTYSSSMVIKSKSLDPATGRPLPDIVIPMKTSSTSDMTETNVGLQDSQFSQTTQNITNESLIEQGREEAAEEAEEALAADEF